MLSIETVKFRVVDAVDEFVRVFKGDGSSLGLFALSPLVSDGVAILDLSSFDYAGTKLGLQATSSASSWRVNWVEGSTQRVDQQVITTFVEEEVETQSAPTPAAAGLGLVGMAGMLLARRRRD